VWGVTTASTVDPIDVDLSPDTLLEAEPYWDAGPFLISCMPLLPATAMVPDEPPHADTPIQAGTSLQRAAVEASRSAASAALAQWMGDVDLGEE
jgi:hypothetical protein